MKKEKDPEAERWYNSLTKREQYYVDRWIEKNYPETWIYNGIAYAYTEMPFDLHKWTRFIFV